MRLRPTALGDARPGRSLSRNVVWLTVSQQLILDSSLKRPHCEAPTVETIRMGPASTSSSVSAAIQC
jgi:hypothetical protein